CRRCSAVASSKRGYWASGTEIVRPSISATVNSFSSIRADRTRVAVATEIGMPSLQKLIAMQLDESAKLAQSMRRNPMLRAIATVSSQKLRRPTSLVYINVRRLARLMAIEVEPIAPQTQHGRHKG